MSNINDNENTTTINNQINPAVHEYIKKSICRCNFGVKVIEIVCSNSPDEQIPKIIAALAEETGYEAEYLKDIWEDICNDADDETIFDDFIRITLERLVSINQFNKAYQLLPMHIHVPPSRLPDLPTGRHQQKAGQLSHVVTQPTVIFNS